MKVSVIIPTYNRGQPLVDTLKSLLDQDCRNFEIIIVDQSDKRFSEKEKFLAKNKQHLRLFRLTKPSIPKAINLGVKQAKGEIVLLLDDDVLTSKDLILNHLANYSKGNWAGVLGRVVTIGQEEESNFTGVGKISPWGKVSGGFSSNIRQEVDNVIGCNFSLRKDVFEEVGGVDNNFIGNCLRWETDLALRMRKSGKKIIFDPKAELTHVRAETGGCRKDNRLKWYHDFFHNEAYFKFKYIKWYWWLIFWLTRWQWFGRCMFGFGREVSWHSLKTPFLGIYYGWQSFERWSNENRC